MLDHLIHLFAHWSFPQALQLYQAAGINPAKARLIDRMGQSLFFEKQLRTELQQLLHTLQEDARLQQLSRPSRSQIEANYPDHMKELLQRRNKAVREQDYLRGQITPEQTNDERLQLALRILDLDDHINGIWKQIHHFDQHGTLPPDEVEAIIRTATTWFDLLKIYTNYKANASKARTGKLAADKLPFYNQVIARAESVLNQPIAPSLRSEAEKSPISSRQTSSHSTPSS